jgi:hypothetical protein
MIQHRERMRPDLGRRPECPHGHQSVFSQIGRRQRSAMLLGQVKVDRQRPVQHQAAIFDRRDMAVRVYFQKLGRLGMQDTFAAADRLADKAGSPAPA